MPPPAINIEPAQRLIDRSRLEDARAWLLRALAKAPGDAPGNSLASFVLLSLGEPDRALYYAERAAREAPRDARFRINVGNALAQLGRFTEAERVFREALALDPGLSEAGAGLSHALLTQRRWFDAREVARAALGYDPENAKLLGNYVACVGALGRPREAVRLLRGAVARASQDLDLLSTLANATSYAGALSPEEVFAAHRSFGEALERLPAPAPPPFANPPDPDRRLRVGLLSPDLRAHAVAFFIEPAVERLERERFEVVCYHASAAEDGVSARLRAKSDAWRAVARLSAGDLASLIRKDGVDVLIDLAGHTAGNRLVALQLRPAPVQATYLGYHNTTGMRAVDWRIVDSVTDPVGAEPFSVERLRRLDPCFLCYRPPSGFGPPTPLPAQRNGFVTVGAFNSISKLDDDVAALWARVLDAIPSARLVLMHNALLQPEARDEVRDRLVDAGADAARLEARAPTSGPAELFDAWDGIDFALDTFPFNGATTTCEGAYRGVPTVTMLGDRSASRVGASINRALGLDDLVADSPEHYVRIAAGLAADLPRLAAIRASLPARLASGPLGDEAAFARRFGEAIRAMWRDWCATRSGAHG